MVSAPSQACQGLQHMPPNPWCPLHNKNRPVNGARTLSVHPCQPQTDPNPPHSSSSPPNSFTAGWHWLSTFGKWTQGRLEKDEVKCAFLSLLKVGVKENLCCAVLCCVATEVHQMQGGFTFFSRWKQVKRHGIPHAISCLDRLSEIEFLRWMDGRTDW